MRPGSPAFIAGLQTDDVLVSVNGKEAKTANDFAAAIKELPQGGLIKLLVRRGSSTLFVPMLKP